MGARRIVLYERAETPLFFVDEELRRRFPSIEVSPVLADVTDEAAVQRIFDRERPHVVLHAAAHKHVPLSESNPSAAVLANVRGTRFVAEAAARFGCDVFLLVSTDKAVDPASVMGASKRVAERLVQRIGMDAPGRFVVVRFGNVLGSQGSVIELFRQQIAEGGPITITHPEMTRFFMTIPEAVRLILLSAAVGRSGDVHVLDMGEPIRIVDLARDLIRLSVPGGSKDIQVTFVGLRPGERLEERLFGEDEEPIATEFLQIRVARMAAANGSASENVAAHVALLERHAACGDDEAVRSTLRVVDG
jgi:FlaA1/EpsC-like NDP-sugar epimerase